MSFGGQGLIKDLFPNSSITTSTKAPTPSYKPAIAATYNQLDAQPKTPPSALPAATYRHVRITPITESDVKVLQTLLGL